ncbi:TPA: hypothetical protein ACW0T4_003527 [Morganella morganii]
MTNTENKTSSGDFTFLNAIYGSRSGVGKSTHFVIDRPIDNLDKSLKMANDNLEIMDNKKHD